MPASIPRENALNKWLGSGLVLAMGVAAQVADAQEAAMPVELQQLDATVERVRQQFDVPGVAVAVVKDGKVVLERGWGLREIGRPEPVQADTLCIHGDQPNALIFADGIRKALEQAGIEVRTPPRG